MNIEFCLSLDGSRKLIALAIAFGVSQQDTFAIFCTVFCQQERQILAPTNTGPLEFLGWIPRVRQLISVAMLHQRRAVTSLNHPAGEAFSPLFIALNP